MTDPVLASERYDLDEVPPHSLDDRHYCAEHDLFKVKDAMGDRICPACAVAATLDRNP